MKEQLWKITFYDKSAEDETLSLPDTILANLLRILEMAREVGPNLGRPHSAPLGDGLFEFRAKGKEGIARSVFVNVVNREIVILHTLIKKSDAIPKKDMKIIIQRAKEIK
ncbi:type II toxin-antitoxin system RelE/ParE family toxin [Campylobacter concisus]|uniref:Type II toxin-antitoxin system RelE/ParE family toxin n=1 Tax=Campylobacter concisus TaxID=199 RepID=A0AAE7TN78_9BACT|nr:type II toxin-antitoxin system RelE/ParE family toxin [Campylobacter concisus]QPH85524.1 type II toxin-antitoxin system RelE/ParE family toxin [Campylobacter concisus]